MQCTSGLKYHSESRPWMLRRIVGPLFISVERTHASVFQRLIRPGVLALNLEIALELSAESARPRESPWYKLFVGRKLRSECDGWPSTQAGILFSLLIIPAGAPASSAGKKIVRWSALIALGCWGIALRFLRRARRNHVALNRWKIMEASRPSFPLPLQIFCHNCSRALKNRCSGKSKLLAEKSVESTRLITCKNKWHVQQREYSSAFLGVLFYKCLLK